jgi:chlorobactene glucosyltransferase
MNLLLLCLPWLLVGLFLVLFVRIPPRMPTPSTGGVDHLPLVSIVVPARNEEVNLPRLLESLGALVYPRFEVLVVDDESTDGTGDLVLAADAGNAENIRLVSGQPLPPGWFGKPWACHQGAREARGFLLLFTDADTVHEPHLLAQAVACMQAEEADAVTLIGRQVMESFWEQLLQPQFFALLAARFPRAGTPKKPKHWREAIANGQYLLFQRDAYREFGGHEAVKGEVVEDMRIAQLLVKGGGKLVVREGLGLRTRMYRSLGGLVEGWSKNFSTGVLQTSPGFLRPVALPLSLLIGTALWLLPPAVLAWSLATGTGGLALQFGSVVTGFGVVHWGLASWVMRGNPLFGFLYPLGSVVAAYIFTLSWVRGNRVHWKGRAYQMDDGVRRGEEGVAGKQPGKVNADER